MKTLFILLGVFAITPFLYAQDAELKISGKTYQCREIE